MLATDQRFSACIICKQSYMSHRRCDVPLTAAKLLCSLPRRHALQTQSLYAPQRPQQCRSSTRRCTRLAPCCSCVFAPSGAAACTALCQHTVHSLQCVIQRVTIKAVLRSQLVLDLVIVNVQLLNCALDEVLVRRRGLQVEGGIEVLHRGVDVTKLLVDAAHLEEHCRFPRRDVLRAPCDEITRQSPT